MDPDLDAVLEELVDEPAPLAPVVDIRSARSFPGGGGGGPRLMVGCPRCLAASGRWCRPGGELQSDPVTGFLHVERATTSR